MEVPWTPHFKKFMVEAALGPWAWEVNFSFLKGLPLYRKSHPLKLYFSDPTLRSRKEPGA
jgi:hypothetical protein